MPHVRHLAVSALLLASTSGWAQTADRIWSGGPILTMNDSAMRAEAIAEAGGKIIAVGSKAEVMKTRGPRTQLIDLKGRTLLPGFVDPHGHVGMGGLQALSANLLAPPDGEVRDIPSLIATLKAWVAQNQASMKAANLIIGFGYDNSQLKELRHPTKEELDQVSTEIPVLIVHQSSHLATLNSAALKAVGFDSSTKDPAGGVIQRKPGTTEPNGTVEETAFNAVVPKLLAGVGKKGLETFAREGAKLWARYGYTTAQEGRAVPVVAEAMRKVAAEGGFPIDVAVYPDVLAARDYIKANLSPTYVNRLRIAGAKLSIDGSPQGFTAWRDKPYHDPVGNYPEGYSGYAAATAEQVMGSISWAAENKVPILTHVSGERASDLLIAATSAAQARFPASKDLRPVAIHGHFLREDQVDSFQRLGILPSLFPMHTFYWGDWHLNHTVGPVAGMNISPTGWVRKRGMIFTTHHDAPVAFPNSMRVLDATVTRRARGSGRIVGPEHRVDVITGLKAMTIWPAMQNAEEATKGTLEPGKLADFVILSKDPTAVAPTTIADIQVSETVKEGKTVFALQPGKRADAADMTPLLVALAGPQRFQPFAPARQQGQADDATIHDGLARLSDVFEAAGSR